MIADTDTPGTRSCNAGDRRRRTVSARRCARKHQALAVAKLSATRRANHHAAAAASENNTLQHLRPPPYRPHVSQALH